jgi:hypothetical protein
MENGEEKDHDLSALLYHPGRFNNTGYSGSSRALQHCGCPDVPLTPRGATT